MKKILLLTLFVCLAACQSSSDDNLALDEFYYQLEDAFQTGNVPFLNSAFHNEALIKKAVGEIGGPEEFRDGFVKGIFDNFQGGMFFRDYIPNDARVKYLGMRDNRGLYRIVDRRGTMDYLYIYPDTKSDSIGISDVFFLVDGEELSVSVNRAYQISRAESDSTFTSTFYNSVEDIQKIVQENQAGNLEEAVRILDNLPDELQQQKLILLIDLNLSIEKMPERLDNILERFEKIDPKDPTPYLHLLMQSLKSTDIKLPLIDQLDEKIGGDSYLDFYRALYYQQNDDMENALAAMYRTLEANPKMSELHFTIFDLLIRDKRYDETLEAFANFQESEKLNAANFVVYDPYKEFLNSPEFASWVKDNPLDGSSQTAWEKILVPAEAVPQ